MSTGFCRSSKESERSESVARLEFAIRGASRELPGPERRRKRRITSTKAAPHSNENRGGKTEKETEKKQREDVRNKRWLFEQYECLPNDVKHHGGQALFEPTPVRTVNIRVRRWLILSQKSLGKKFLRTKKKLNGSTIYIAKSNTMRDKRMKHTRYKYSNIKDNKRTE